MVAIRWRTRCGVRKAAKGATPPCISEVCTDERRNHGDRRLPEPHDALRSQMTSVARGTELRRTVEQIVDTTLIVPSLHVPVPQRENQLVEVCRQLDIIIPEQAVEVSKTSSSSRHSRRRRVRFAQQTEEQLVEVPTIVSVSCLRNRTRTFQFLVVVAVVSVSEVFKGSLDRISQLLTLLFRAVEVFKVLARDRLQVLHPRTCLVSRMRLYRGVSNFSPN